MLSAHIFLDESGDLGWKFDRPYRMGGSSRYLTIAALVVPQIKKHLPTRLIKQLYNQHNWQFKKEKKWVDMKPHERMGFVKKARFLAEQHKDIKYAAITVNKVNVQSHIRSDENKLYNYMIGLMLLDEMKRFDEPA